MLLSRSQFVPLASIARRNAGSSSRSCLFSTRLFIPTADDMNELGAVLACLLFEKSNEAVRGSVLCLGGDLGAGKTALAAGFVEAATGVSRVTSPTYLLDNCYSTPTNLEVHHIDLYRLTGKNDLGPLNLPHVFQNCVSLIEWPSRLGEEGLPKERLDIDIQFLDNDSDETTRLLTLEPHGQDWVERLKALDDYVQDWKNEQ
jgi:tRNA threonylcarbamoyladenosine biosynthesis protein TsaE